MAASTYNPIYNIKLQQPACSHASRATFTQMTQSLACEDAELVRDAHGQGQLCVLVDDEFFVSSGSICLLGPSSDFKPANAKFFFITCAHNFFHEHKLELDVNNEGWVWKEATSAVVHYAKEAPTKYAVKAQVKEVRVHPKYSNMPGGYDFALGLLEGKFSEAPCSGLAYWSYYEYISPVIGDKICVIGYPAIKLGFAYSQSGTIAGVTDTVAGGKLLVS